MTTVPSVKPEAPPLPRFDSIAVVSNGVTDDLRTRFNRDSLEKGASIGAGGGALVGLGAATACGPWFVLCAMGTVPVGAVVGAVGGAGVGAASDARKRPEPEQLDRLEAHFESVRETRNLPEEIRSAVDARVPIDRRADSNAADALFRLTLSDVRFMQVDTEVYALSLESKLEVQWNRGTRQLRSTRRDYRWQSRAEPIEFWTEDDGTRLGQAFDACIEGLASEVEQHLRFSEKTTNH